MRKGAEFAVDNARLIKKKLVWAVLRHGKHIGDHEFFLARLTSLSLYTYGILALLAVIESRRKQGLEIAELLLVLEYFVAEAGEERRAATSEFHEVRDKLHGQLFKIIDRDGSEDKK
jgi:acyl-CoA dehydrogenase family protein 9